MITPIAFTYWPVCVASGGEVLAPGRPDRFIQFIDVRDMAESLLNECKSVAGTDAQFTWASENFLLDERVAAWSELPLWLPEEAAPHLKGFMFVSPDKAIAAGLTYRPLSETIRDTLAWYQTNRAGEHLNAGLDRDKERALLYKWQHGLRES